MNQKNTNSEFERGENIKFKGNVFNQSQREAIKLKIVDKFNVSPDESEKLMLELEKKLVNDKIVNNFNSNDYLSNEDSKKIQNKYKNDDLSNKMQLNRKNNIMNNNENFYKKNSFSNLKNKQFDDETINHLKKEFSNKNSRLEKSNIPQNINQKETIDNILHNIVPDYDSQISIKLDHVDLTFEVQNEKIDTLKETFIRTLKRNKSKKIKIHALNDISFEIYKGEKVGVIGFNGAGKSTLLSVITGIYLPDKGTVTTNGNISPLLSLGAGFDHNFSGRKNIMLNGAVLGYDKEFLESKVDEIIEFSELGEFIDIPIKNYSSGMLAKLGFSIATAVEPDILIIDEILGVGDVNFQKKCREKIMSLMDGGTTLILVSHAIPQIRNLCDKAIWIDNGCLRDIGEVNKVCDEYLKDSEKATKEQLENIQFR